MANQFAIQVPKEQYFKEYDDVTRFISYFYQIDLLRKLEPDNVLEIGIGNKTVANYLKQNGTKVDTCDFDKDLEPDYVGDIRNLPFQDSSYDVVMACEILEHIPWEDVETALSELRRISRRYALISIPYSTTGFELLLKFPLLKRILGKPWLDIFLRISLSFLNMEFSGEHYWEMGRKNYPAKRIRSTLSKYFKVCKEIRPILNPYHMFFRRFRVLSG